MTPNHPSCPEQCDAFTPGDNYCRQCGMFVGATTLPVRSTMTMPVASEQHITMVERNTTRALDRPRGQLPAPVVRAAAAVAVGTALQVGIAMAARYFASSAPKPVPAPRRRRVPSAPPPPPEAPAALDSSIVAVSESVTFIRTWIRRG